MNKSRAFEKLCNIIEKLEKNNSYYEILHLLFLTQNILDKEKLNFIINNIKNQELKINILKKMIQVNSNIYKNEKNEVFKLNKLEFNIQLNIFLNKIDFLV